MSVRTIELRYASPQEVSIEKKEAFSYMGLNNAFTDSDIQALFASCMDEIKGELSFKACFTRVNISFPSYGKTELGFCTAESPQLFTCLKNCRQAFVFAATAGAGVDRLISRYGRLSPLRALMLDAIGSAAVEGFCNMLCAEFESSAPITPRFSPGYGDFSLSYQRALLSFLDAQRKIGVSLSGEMLMTPVKSVTAIAGIRETEK